MTRSVDNGQLYRPVKWGESPDRHGRIGKPLMSNDLLGLLSQGMPGAQLPNRPQAKPHPRERRLTYDHTFPTSKPWAVAHQNF